MTQKIPYFVNLADAPRLTQMPGLETTILTGLCGEKMMMVLNATLPGHTVPTHSHPHEQFSFMIEGKMRLFVGDQEKIVSPGDIWYAPPNVVHGGELLGDAPVIFVDVFTPIREDVLEEMKERGG